MQHVEQQDGVRRLEIDSARVAADHVGGAGERGARDRGDAAARLDADHAIESRRRRPIVGPLAVLARPARFGEQRERQALAAADVDQRAPAGQQIRRQHRAVRRIHPQLAARELPRGDARFDVAVRRAPHEIGEPAIGARLAHEAVGARPRDRRDDGADDDAADHGVDAEDGEAGRRDRVPRQRMKRAAADPRARLHFRDHEPRRDERVRDVRREIHLEAIEAEQRAGDPAEQQVESVEREAADEGAERDCGGLARGAGAFGPQAGERAAHANAPPRRIRRRQASRCRPRSGRRPPSRCPRSCRGRRAGRRRARALRA